MVSIPAQTLGLNQFSTHRLEVRSDESHHKKVATFAGAIGGCVGVLLLVALGTFISIYRRRRRTKKREAEQDEEKSSCKSTENQAEATGRTTLPVMSQTSTAPAAATSVGRIQAERFDDEDHGLAGPEVDGTADVPPVIQIPLPLARSETYLSSSSSRSTQTAQPPPQAQPARASTGGIASTMQHDSATHAGYHPPPGIVPMAIAQPTEHISVSDAPNSTPT